MLVSLKFNISYFWGDMTAALKVKEKSVSKHKSVNANVSVLVTIALFVVLLI